MFKSEVLIELEDKKRLLALLSEAKAILDKYPYSNDHSDHLIAVMSRAKTSVQELTTAVRCLQTQRDE